MRREHNFKVISVSTSYDTIVRTIGQPVEKVSPLWLYELPSKRIKYKFKKFVMNFFLVLSVYYCVFLDILYVCNIRFRYECTKKWIGVGNIKYTLPRHRHSLLMLCAIKVRYDILCIVC